MKCKRASAPEADCRQTPLSMNYSNWAFERDNDLWLAAMLTP